MPNFFFQHFNLWDTSWWKRSLLAAGLPSWGESILEQKLGPSLCCRWKRMKSDSRGDANVGKRCVSGKLCVSNLYSQREIHFVRQWSLPLTVRCLTNIYGIDGSLSLQFNSYSFCPSREHMAFPWASLTVCFSWRETKHVTSVCASMG